MGKVSPPPISVLRPKLPSAEKLLPYLQEIDRRRLYSNFGPLSKRLEAKLSTVFSVPRGSVVCTSSGTAAIVASILAVTGRAKNDKKYAVVPGFTFPATALAAEQCGFIPYFVDVVDFPLGQISPVDLLRHPLLKSFGLVLPVATFGRPVEQEAWQAFQKSTGIPVVIDAAASFSLVSDDPKAHVGQIPVAMSFHATKSFGVGEGGCIIWPVPDAERRLSEVLNFGFYETRVTRVPSGNGKMSEYHAAVGLAQLDAWKVTRRALNAVSRNYRERFATAGLGDRFQHYPATDWIYPIFKAVTDHEGELIRMALDRARIGYRMWYGEGMHAHPYFVNAPRDELPVTLRLGRRLVGLPMAVDLADQDIARICRILADATCSVSTINSTEASGDPEQFASHS